MASSTSLDLHRPEGRRTLALPERYRARVLAAFPGQVERIVLFGSRARGDLHPDSDWDFAVFLDHEPSAKDRKRVNEIDWDLVAASGDLIQSHVLASERWVATDELACNIRDDGLIIHGQDHLPMIQRPVLEHARAALAKAGRYAELAAETVDERFEGVIHGAYYAMFHAARAALLAVEGSASTNHGRVVDTFGRMIEREQLGEVAEGLARTLSRAYKLRAEADYGSKDLTRTGRRLRARVAPFLDFCRNLVDQHPDRGRGSKDRICPRS